MSDSSLKEIRIRLGNLIRTHIIPFQSATVNKGAVFDTAPMKLNHASLPAIVIVDGQTAYSDEKRGRNNILATTTFNITLYQGEWQANQDNNINLSALDQTITDLEDLLVVYRNLEAVDGSSCRVEDTFLRTATGITAAPYVPIQGILPSQEIYVQKRLPINVRWSRYIQGIRTV